MKKRVIDILPEIILSVGTHRKKRLLSPIEVSERFAMLLNQGYSKEKIAEFVKLDPSMLERFIRLLQLEPYIKHLVDWGRSNKSAISFSAASEISLLNPKDQIHVTEAILKYQLTKSETKQITEIKKRSSKEISNCINEVLNMRPRIICKHVFLGTITDDRIISKLKKKTQKERDKTLKDILNKRLLPEMEWDGRLGKNRFTLVGGVLFNKQVSKFKPNFEKALNTWLVEELLND